MLDEYDVYREMPRYRCHKEVHALKIAEVVGLHSDVLTLKFANPGYADLRVPRDTDFFDRVKATEADPGYLVQYDDGYRSWSPTKAFEDGYTEIA